PKASLTRTLTANIDAPHGRICPAFTTCSSYLPYLGAIFHNTATLLALFCNHQEVSLLLKGICLCGVPGRKGRRPKELKNFIPVTVIAALMLAGTASAGISAESLKGSEIRALFPGQFSGTWKGQHRVTINVSQNG